VHVQQLNSCIKEHLPSFHWICGRQSVITLTQLNTRLGAACKNIQEASIRDMAQKQRLVEVRADFEQTIVKKAIDQWRIKPLSKLKDNTLNTGCLSYLAFCGQLKCFKQLELSLKTVKRLHCQTCAVDQRALFCNDAMVSQYSLPKISITGLFW